MSDKKNSLADMTSDVLLADTMLRLTALETVLLEKRIFTKDELKAITDVLVEKVTEIIVSKANSSQNLDQFIDALGRDTKKDQN